MSEEAGPPRRVRWAEVALFYVIAVAVSAPFRLEWVDPHKVLPLPGALAPFSHVLRALGPAVGFVVMARLVRSPSARAMTFFGVSAPLSIAAAAVLPVGLAIIGVSSKEGLPPHEAGLVAGLSLILYAIGEEYGWRGYIQQALEPLALPLRVFLIGALWYVWHLNFLLPGTPLAMHVIHFSSLVLGAWGLLKLTKVTRSILFAAAIHLSFNIIFGVDAPMSRKLCVLGAAALTWFVLIRWWCRRTAER